MFWFFSQCQHLLYIEYLDKFWNNYLHFIMPFTQKDLTVLYKCVCIPQCTHMYDEVW